MDTGPETADQHVGSRDALFFHDSQRRVDATPCRNAESHALAVVFHDVNEAFQGVRIADQVLVQVCENGPVPIAYARYWPFTRNWLVPAWQVPRLLHVAFGMRLPGVMFPDTRNPVARSQIPGVAIAQKLEQCRGNGLLVERVDEFPVVAVGDDIDRSAILRGNQWQPAGSGLQQCQAKGFCQRGVDEDAMAGCHESVDFRDLVGAMALGDCDLAIEVVGIDEQQDIGQDVLRTAVEVTDVIARAGNDEQVGVLLQ